MKRPKGRTLVVAATLLFVSGCFGGGCVGAIATPFDRGRTIYARLPHHVAPTAEATPFRFAMVHDVIHERYPRHGAAFYQERERLARERLAVVHPDSVTAFAAIDDIAVGLDRQGQTDEAIAMMRDKLKRQQALDRPSDNRYSSHANLGEFLIHKNLWAMLGGDAAARKGVQEGLDFLRASVAINPQAHFGQEEWQIVAVNALLAGSVNPDLLRKCDLIGNRLDIPIEIPKEVWHAAAYNYEQYKLDDPVDEAQFLRPYYRQFSERLLYGERVDEFADPLNGDLDRSSYRKFIQQVGGETAPKESGEPKRGRRAPFDEPAMWLISEWRHGSGPSPHLALCLGEIMLRVGQRYLAWTCYERAIRLAEQFSPKVEAQNFLRVHCRSCQIYIEESLPAKEVATLRSKFQSELAFGEAYQRDYQAYTEQKFRAGASLADPNFFDEFNGARPPIASKVGPEEWYASEIRSHGIKGKTLAFWTWGLLVGGVLLLLGGLMANWKMRPRLKVTEITPPPSPVTE